LPQHRALLAADVHLGKAASFRALGVSVPETTTGATLEALSRLCEAQGADVLFVLGDLLHGPAAQQAGVIDALERWRARHASVRVILVRGNHDDRAGDPPPRCGIEVLPGPFTLGGLQLDHEPPPDPAGRAWVCGHLHPACRLRAGGDSLRLPAWWLRDGVLVLPAFGEFTGGWLVEPHAGEGLWVSDGARVFRLPEPPQRAGPRGSGGPRR
jgi:DNA ligase-associated metallophosphoesterase